MHNQVHQALSVPAVHAVCTSGVSWAHCLPPIASLCTGAAKLRGSLLREVVLGVLAGAYIGFGFSLCMLCAGQVSQHSWWAKRSSRPRGGRTVLQHAQATAWVYAIGWLV
jgi:hypothetical protein